MGLCNLHQAEFPHNGRPSTNAILRGQSTCHKLSVCGHVSDFHSTHAASLPNGRAVIRAMFTDGVQPLHCHHHCRHHQQCHCTSFEPQIDQPQCSMALTCTCCNKFIDKIYCKNTCLKNISSMVPECYHRILIFPLTQRQSVVCQWVHLASLLVISCCV